MYVIWRSAPNIIVLVEWKKKLRTQRKVLRTEHEACVKINVFQTDKRGARWRSWLRHCATSRKVVGLIRDGDIWHNPSGRTMFLRLTQPLIEMSTEPPGP